MKEVFRDIRSKIGEKFNELLRIALDAPLPYEEVVANFEHDKDCSRTYPLRTIEREEFLNLYDGGAWGLNAGTLRVTQRYVECDECHASVRFSGES